MPAKNAWHTLSARRCREQAANAFEDSALHLSRTSPRFGVGSLLDLIKSGIGAPNPFARLIDFSRIHRNGAWDLLRPCDQPPLILHGFRAFDWEFPMVSEPVERVIHRLGFNGAHAAAAHRVVKHAVAILPRAIALPVSDIVQDRGVPIFSFESPAHDRPEVAWDGSAIDNRSCWRDPDDALRISVPQFAFQRHGSSIRIPSRHRFTAVVTPFGVLLRAGKPTYFLV